MMFLKLALSLFLALSTLPLVAADSYVPKNYDHLLGNVNGLDDALLKMHFTLYQGYVKNSNLVLQKLQELSNSGQNRTPEFAGLKRILGWEVDGMLLHELYFENLGSSNLDETSALHQKIINDFGSYEKWKADFVATGLMRGIGWAIAYIDPKEGRLINAWINEHDLGHLAGGTPVLIMDVFEHAYITQFGLERAKYVDVFFNNINWKVAAERYQRSPFGKK
jgi:Fe-Mn family superoxide dismutase